MSATRVVLLTLGATVLAMFLLGLIAPIFMILALLTPLGTKALIERKLRQVRGEFADQLPPNLQVLASALRVGQSFIGALTVVVENAHEPSKSELQRVLTDEQLGVPIEEAIRRVAARMASRDLEQVALLAELQRTAGGNAAEVLDTVVETLRERADLRRLVQTLTAQGRLARWILSALPVAAGLSLAAIQPTAILPMVQSGSARSASWSRRCSWSQGHSSSRRSSTSRSRSHMIILLLFGIALVAVSAGLAVRAVTIGGLRRRNTLAQIASYGFAGPVVAPEARERRGPRALLDSLATLLGTIAVRRFASMREQETRKLLRSAGLYQMQAETFVGYRLLAAGGIPALWLLLSLGSGGVSPRGLLILCFVAAQGWILPSFFIKRRGTKRLHDIDLEMPELVDLLVTTVEAGVGFAAALQLVARRVEGPLGHELRITLQEQNMGLTIENALQNMLERVESASVRAFVQAMIQGQNLGVSIGKILRDLAVDMRKRRRQMAEERAQKAPTKILFPLVFLILPALFIIVLGGPMIGLGQTLGSLA
jgi:Flp pilus assembly protein TadB